ncbi:hypothetical protein AWB71_00534 [Caballeronia peredens]|nr:hypothetical protein AWB71_00534 [Caballeronia peredens]
MKIIYDAALQSGATEWYGNIIVKNLRYEDGTPVKFTKFLSMNFKSPASVDATFITVQFAQWVIDPAATTVTNTQIDASTFSVTATLPLIAGIASYTLVVDDAISIGVNGDLTQDTEAWLNSFVFAADAAPAITGTALVACGPSPDPALDAVTPQIVFTLGSTSTPLNLQYGQSTSIDLEQGAYAITGKPVSNADQTVVADLLIQPGQANIATGQTTNVTVSFQPVQRFAALDVAIGNLSGLSTEILDVTVSNIATGATLAQFQSGVNQTTQLRRLPVGVTAQVSIKPIALNNVNFSFVVAAVVLENALKTVSITDSNVTQTPVDTQGFVALPVSLTADQTVDRQITVRLTGSMNYAQSFDVQTQQTAFSTPVKPGAYTVVTGNFLDKGIVYAVTAPAQITVSASGTNSLAVSVTRSANLMVRGFPPYLAFGGCADLTPNDKADFVAARATSVFSYAGNDGAGDASVVLDDDPKTRSIIQLARDTEAALGNVQPVLPVIVSYTCNLSGGDADHVLQDATAHTNSFANYILALGIATQSIDSAHPVPAGFIVNPDFLGECQQMKIGPSYAMPVVKPLRDALATRNVTATVPSTITDTLAGYVAAVNWLTRTVAPSVTFGWQVNLWGLGDSEWIYRDDDPASVASQMVSYMNSLGAYGGANAPDFLAVDRYEADDFTQRGYANGYCYWTREWGRYFDFCEQLSLALKMPVMPWQIPASRTPNTSDSVPTSFDSQHWGTGGSCIMGDAAIGSDYNNVNANILALVFPNETEYMGNTAKDMFIRSEPFDVSLPMYADFALRGIFAVLLGGGSTTGIVSSVGNPEAWTRNKLNAYMNAPISFDQ